MTDQHPTAHPTAHTTFTLYADAFASRNDGTSRGDMYEFTIEVEFAERQAGHLIDGRALDAINHITDWVERYLDGVDLTHAFDFAPTPDRIALWVARVCEQHAGETFGAVHLGVRSGNPAIEVRETVRYRP
jgi:hypothetical protein